MVKLSVLVPVYNEERTISKVVRNLKKIKGIEKEIIIVDDFSNDGTRNILRRLNDKSIKVFYHDRNRGKGAAIRTALERSTGDIISIQDADFEYNPKEIPKLLKSILEKKSDVVYGSRLMGKKLILFGSKKTPLPLHWIGNKGLTFLTNLLYFTSITDMETGYNAFRKDGIKDIKLKSTRFDFEPEITAKILKKGYKILEIPISFNPRTQKEGKKITWIDGLKAAYYLIKYRFLD